jgi:anion-transporting  ArsA/GET3 family ATPase
MPSIDFERIFDDMRDEAARIQEFLRDPQHSALVVVTLPEKLPVSETCDLEAAVRTQLGMRVHGIVVNKVQPDPMQGHAGLRPLMEDESARRAFAAKAAAATGQDQVAVEALVSAAEFGALRRRMNLAHLEDLRARLPGVCRTLVPLFRDDVQGLRRLGAYEAELFDASNQEPANPAALV